MQPNLIFDPADGGRSTKKVWSRVPGPASDELIGEVSETVGAGFVATWHDARGNKVIGVYGFRSEEEAGAALYAFDPPQPSARSGALFQPADSWVNAAITVRGETIYAVEEAVNEAILALADGHHAYTNEATNYDVTLTARGN